MQDQLIEYLRGLQKVIQQFQNLQKTQEKGASLPVSQSLKRKDSQKVFADAIDCFQKEVHSIFGQMGDFHELFSPKNLKKNIDYSILHHELNLKLLAQQAKKESNSFQKNFSLLKKLEQSLRLVFLSSQNERVFLCNTFDNVNEILTLVNKLIDNVKKYGTLFLNYYQEITQREQTRTSIIKQKIIKIQSVITQLFGKDQSLFSESSQYLQIFSQSQEDFFNMEGLLTDEEKTVLQQFVSLESFDTP